MSETEMNENINEEISEDQAEQEKLKFDVDIQEVSSCERHIKITIQREEVVRYLDKEYEELHQNAAIPGFRPGKAPRKLIEKKFKNDVTERVKNNLILDSLTQVNEGKELTPISEPDLDIKKIVLPEEGEFIYEYNIEVRPEFELPNWNGLKIEKPVRDFTDEDVDRAIKRIQTNYGTLIDSDTPAEEDDYIVTKLTFKQGERIISKADEETIRIRPVLSFHDGVINDFDKLMVGAVAGETRTAKTILSDDTPNYSLKGQEIDAIFDIKAIKKLQIPEVNSDFLYQIGGYSDLGDFRDDILDTLKRQLEYEQQQSARKQITKQLTVEADWQLPPALLERQSARELQRSILELRRSGFSDEKIMSQLNYLRQNVKSSTAQALKEHFILEKIAEVHGIEDSPEDYDVEIALIAAQSGETPRRIRSQIEKRGEMDILRNQIIERKVLNMIQEEAEFVEVPYIMEGITEEALDLAAGSENQESAIPEVSEEEAKEVARNDAEKNLHNFTNSQEHI